MPDYRRDDDRHHRRKSERDDERRRYYRMTPLGRRTVRAEAERLASAVAAAKSKRLFKLAGDKA